MRVCVLWSVLALVCACVEPSSVATAVSEDESSSELRTFRAKDDLVPASARPCSDELFFIDVPFEIGSVDGVSLDRLTSEISNRVSNDWFCDGGGCEGSVRMRAVLPKRTKPAWRADGHLRFFRFHFEDPSAPGERLKLLPKKQCEAITAIRQAAREALGNDTVYVGRVCSGSTAGVEAYATAEMLNWHLERIDVRHPPSAGTESLVDVAIIDTGIEPYLGAEFAMDLVDGTTSGPLHHHGTEMALLVQQIAPNATIHDYRVMDEDGFGTPADVATAFDNALFELGGSRPLVVNMSLGWPSELGRQSVLLDSNSRLCGYEDPVGEPVRYLMAHAAERSDVTLVVAAGNQPARSGDDIFPSDPSDLASLPSNDWLNPVECPPSVNAWFYPAEWTHNGISGSGGASGCAPTSGFAVSGTDVRNQPLAIAIPGTETRLVAPGQHVYVTHEDAPPAPEVRCTGGQSEIVVGPREFRSPSSMTGTSVAAALMSGAAALAQRESILRTGELLDTESLQGLLYASGLNLGRGSVDGYDVRLLNIGRMKTLLGCEDALSCLVQYPFHDCVGVFAGCGSPIASAPGTQSVPWPVDFEQRVEDCPKRTVDKLQTCGPGVCAFERAPNRTLLNELGPQPSHAGGCIEPGISASRGRVVLTINDRSVTDEKSKRDIGSKISLHDMPGLEDGATFYLVLDGVDRNTGIRDVHYADLRLDDLGPGQTAVIDFGNSLPKLDWTTAKATLVTEIEREDALSSTDYAPVRILE
ncbi:MAG: S8/S53 family peptidase [Myxococcota bacterium]